MRKLEINDAEIIKCAVQDEIIRSEDSRYDHRLHGILLICSGFNCYEVAELFGQSPRTVHYWVQSFEASGFAGLKETKRPGRPSVIDEKIREQIGKDLRRSPRDIGYEQNFWDGKLFSHHLAKKYRVSLGVRQCQRLFKQLEFRLRKPRPVIAKADPQATQAFKKTPQAGRKKRA